MVHKAENGDYQGLWKLATEEPQQQLSLFRCSAFLFAGENVCILALS